MHLAFFSILDARTGVITALVSGDCLFYDMIVIGFIVALPGLLLTYKIIKPQREKTNNLGSDQVRHKPDCTVTEDG